MCLFEPPLTNRMAESPATPLPIPPAGTENNSSISSSLPPTKSEPTEVTLYIGKFTSLHQMITIHHLTPHSSRYLHPYSQATSRGRTTTK